MKVAFKTFGCKTNISETEMLIAESKKLGIEVLSPECPADVYVINSCAVTYSAERDTRREIQRLKRINPNAKIAVIGCFSELFKDEFFKLDDVDFIAGTRNKFSVLSFLTGNFIHSMNDRIFCDTFSGSEHSRAFIKIQDGCNFKCSYCVVNVARGKSKSLNPEKVLKMIYEAYELGFNEVVLSGIHIGQYGLDIGFSLDLLLKKIFLESKGPRIRLTTLNPLEISDYMISLLNEEERFCPHFHIGLQSGSDKVLEKMGRTYKRAKFINISEKIFKKYPDTFIGLDIIAGFPGEENKDHEDTLTLLKDFYWTKLHVFSYSKRRNTTAAQMSGHVSDSIKTSRVRELKTISNERYNRFIESQIGKTLTVLVERVDNRQCSTGHTENYVPVLIKEKCVSRQLLKCKGIAKKGEKLITEPI